MVNGVNPNQAAAIARVELCRLALAILVLNAGGRIKLTDEDLTNQPVGVLQIGWQGENLEVRYTPENNAPPIGEEGVLSLAILTWKAGGRIVIKGADADKMPNGQLGFVIEDDGILWGYSQERRH